jgi:hypothetical protein
VAECERTRRDGQRTDTTHYLFNARAEPLTDRGDHSRSATLATAEDGHAYMHNTCSIVYTYYCSACIHAYMRYVYILVHAYKSQHHGAPNRYPHLLPHMHVCMHTCTYLHVRGASLAMLHAPCSMLHASCLDCTTNPLLRVAKLSARDPKHRPSRPTSKPPPRRSARTGWVIHSKQ